MELDLLVDFMPIFSIILFIIVTICTVLLKLKLRWPVTLNCWFCNNNSKIWRQQLNWWLCPHCEQYNGFSKNGDYAYSIPEQYKTSTYNNKRYCSIDQSTKINKVSTNGLCNQCTKNETLKLSKLSNYVPTNDRNYDREVKQFKKSLEQEYPLCTKCKSTVNNILYKQALWLAEYKMLLFKQKPFDVITNNAKYSEPIFRIISTIFDSMVVYNMDLIFLPIGGLFFQFCTCCVASARRKSSDILLMFLWICIIILLPYKDSKIMKLNLHNKWFSFEYITQYHMIMLFTSIIGFINIKPKSHKSTMNKNMSFKKLGSSSKNTMLSGSYMTTSDDEHSFDTKITSDVGESISNKFSPNITNESIPFYMGKSINKRTLFQIPFTNQESQLTTTPVNNNSLLFNSLSLSTHKTNMAENCSLNDSLSILSTLSLSEDKSKYTIKNKAPKIFERKVYSTETSKLFKRLNGTLSKKNSLSPPKSKSVTQATWVTDGYWQDGMDPPSLSRSSSPSSGFGSVGSNFYPSREPSIHEFDQCSIMSDFNQSYHITKQTNISPNRTFYQSSLQFPFPDLKNSVNNQAAKFTSSNMYTPQKLLLFQTGQKNGSAFMDQCLQTQTVNENDIKNPSEIQTLPCHTTVVTVPVWLSVVLCGSLILNITVFWTTLLR
ncbi:uncharacterized protein LOC116429606 [Nomia melanderi]|uniref:uncharacterized protein LOC116429606 n=1 Tax=Nomia melanderi TaxID=2448451 RepID=UPI0013045350|nr:uncharacterized protein LOC116429606 [Nomia melanderi]